MQPIFAELGVKINISNKYNDSIPPSHNMTENTNKICINIDAE